MSFIPKIGFHKPGQKHGTMVTIGVDPKVENEDIEQLNENEKIVNSLCFSYEDIDIDPGTQEIWYVDKKDIYKELMGILPNSSFTNRPVILYPIKNGDEVPENMLKTNTFIINENVTNDDTTGLIGVIWTFSSNPEFTNVSNGYNRGEFISGNWEVLLNPYRFIPRKCLDLEVVYVKVEWRTVSNGEDVILSSLPYEFKVNKALMNKYQYEQLPPLQTGNGPGSNNDNDAMTYFKSIKSYIHERAISPNEGYVDIRNQKKCKEILYDSEMVTGNREINIYALFTSDKDPNIQMNGISLVYELKDNLNKTKFLNTMLDRTSHAMVYASFELDDMIHMHGQIEETNGGFRDSHRVLLPEHVQMSPDGKTVIVYYSKKQFENIWNNYNSIYNFINNDRTQYLRHMRCYFTLTTKRPILISMYRKKIFTGNITLNSLNNFWPEIKYEIRNVIGPNQFLCCLNYTEYMNEQIQFKIPSEQIRNIHREFYSCDRDINQYRDYLIGRNRDGGDLDINKHMTINSGVFRRFSLTEAESTNFNNIVLEAHATIDMFKYIRVGDIKGSDTEYILYSPFGLSPVGTGGFDFNNNKIKREPCRVGNIAKFPPLYFTYYVQGINIITESGSFTKDSFKIDITKQSSTYQYLSAPVGLKFKVSSTGNEVYKNRGTNLMYTLFLYKPTNNALSIDYDTELRKILGSNYRNDLKKKLACRIQFIANDAKLCNIENTGNRFYYQSRYMHRNYVVNYNPTITDVNSTLLDYSSEMAKDKLEFVNISNPIKLLRVQDFGYIWCNSDPFRKRSNGRLAIDPNTIRTPKTGTSGNYFSYLDINLSDSTTCDLTYRKCKDGNFLAATRLETTRTFPQRYYDTSGNPNAVIVALILSLDIKFRDILKIDASDLMKYLAPENNDYQDTSMCLCYSLFSNGFRLSYDNIDSTDLIRGKQKYKLGGIMPLTLCKQLNDNEVLLGFGFGKKEYTTAEVDNPEELGNQNYSCAIVSLNCKLGTAHYSGLRYIGLVLSPQLNSKCPPIQIKNKTNNEVITNIKRNGPIVNMFNKKIDFFFSIYVISHDIIDDWFLPDLKNTHSDTELQNRNVIQRKYRKINKDEITPWAVWLPNVDIRNTSAPKLGHIYKESEFDKKCTHEEKKDFICSTNTNLLRYNQNTRTATGEELVNERFVQKVIYNNRPAVTYTSHEYYSQIAFIYPFRLNLKNFMDRIDPAICRKFLKYHSVKLSSDGRIQFHNVTDGRVICSYNLSNYLTIHVSSYIFNLIPNDWKMDDNDNPIFILETFGSQWVGRAILDLFNGETIRYETTFRGDIYNKKIRGVYTTDFIVSISINLFSNYYNTYPVVLRIPL